MPPEESFAERQRQLFGPAVRQTRVRRPLGMAECGQNVVHNHRLPRPAQILRIHKRPGHARVAHWGAGTRRARVHYRAFPLIRPPFSHCAATLSRVARALLIHAFRTPRGVRQKPNKEHKGDRAMRTHLLLTGCTALAASMMVLTPAHAQGGPGGGYGPPPGGPGHGPGRFGPSPEQFDANQDGKITNEEYTAAWDKVIPEQFKRLDANSDGSLSKEEMEKAHGPGHGPGGGDHGPGDSAGGPPPRHRTGRAAAGARPCGHRAPRQSSLTPTRTARSPRMNTPSRGQMLSRASSRKSTRTRTAA